MIDHNMFCFLLLFSFIPVVAYHGNASLAVKLLLVFHKIYNDNKQKQIRMKIFQSFLPSVENFFAFSPKMVAK